MRKLLKCRPSVHGPGPRAVERRHERQAVSTALGVQLVPGSQGRWGLEDRLPPAGFHPRRGSEGARLTVTSVKVSSPAPPA